MANNMPSFLQGLSQLKKSASALQNNIRNRGDHNSSHHQYQRLQQNDNNFSNAKQYEYDARRASDRLDTGHEKHITNAKQKQRRRTENGSQNVLRDNSTRYVGATIINILLYCNSFTCLLFYYCSSSYYVLDWRM
jgi:hypothetical protein